MGVGHPDIPDIVWHRESLPHQPVVVAAFTGWNDAGDSASQAVKYLRQRTRASRLATIDPEHFVDFATDRPLVALDDDGNRRIDWPDIRLSTAVLPGTDRPIVFVEGAEPALRWKTFCARIIAVAEATEATMVVTLGALLADVPHTRPVEVYGTSDDEAVATRLGLSRSTYEGPTGIVGVLASQCRDAGFATASLWAAVPAYVPGAGSPKAALALLDRLQILLDFGIETTEIEVAALAYERQVSEMIAGDDDTAEYVSELEEHYDSAESPEESVDILLAEVENFLRQQPD
jgi:proteasome assembly chaperone (PAC2) family protein